MKKILPVFVFTCLLFSGFASDIEEELDERALRAQTYFNLGHDKYDEGDYEKAVVYFNKAIETDAKFIAKFMPRLLPKAYNLRGNAKRKLGQYKAAVKDYDKSIELDPACVWVYYNRSDANTKAGHYKKAIADYNTVIQFRPNDDLAYFYRGQAKAKAGQYRQAIMDYNIAISLHLNYPSVYICRADAKFHLKQYAEAIKDYKRAIGMQDHSPQAHIKLNEVKAQIKYEMNKYVLRNLFKCTPKSIFTYYNRPIIKKKSIKPVPKHYAPLYYSTVGLKKKHKEDVRKKIINNYLHNLKLDYQHARTCNKIGDIKLKSAKYQEAIKYYNKAVRLAPQMIDSYMKRGAAKLKSAQYAEARKDFLRAKDLAKIQKKTKLLKAIEKSLKEIEEKDLL